MAYPIDHTIVRPFWAPSLDDFRAFPGVVNGKMSGTDYVVVLAFLIFACLRTHKGSTEWFLCSGRVGKMRVAILHYHIAVDQYQ